MKKMLIALCVALMVFAICALPVIAEAAQSAVDAPQAAEAVADEPEPTSGKLPDAFSWKYLASTGGTAVFVFFVAQFGKVKLDKVWKIPTRLVVYILSLATLLVANGFLNHGLTAEMVALTVFNALISAFSAFGMYEVWVRKKESGLTA